MKDQAVIIVAYACTPHGGTEHGLGWQWVENTAKKHSKVVLVTRPGREGLPQACIEHGIELIEVAVPEPWRQWTQKFGDVGIWIRIYIWAMAVRRVMSNLNNNGQYAYAHLITFHSIWMPYVFDQLTCPKIWGPVSGGEYVPKSYWGLIGPEKWKEIFRNSLDKCIRKSIERRAKKYDVILYGNTQTQKSIETSRCGVNRIVMPNTVEDKKNDESKRSWRKGDVLQLSFVGSCQGRRGMPLLFRALQRMGDLEWKLDIAGTGSALEYWKQQVLELGIADRVVFHGWVGKDVVDDIYNSSHFFAFPTLRDGGGSGMLEAIERGVPVLALDWGGPADVIGESGAGKLFSVHTPERTINELVNWFDEFFQDKVDYEAMINATKNFDFSRFQWGVKMDLLESGLEESKLNAMKTSNSL